jgi:hypothetical protein
MVRAYLTGLPGKFMRTVAGFSTARGSYHLPRAAHEPPELLQRQLWPWVDEWDERFRNALSRKAQIKLREVEEDMAGQGFIKLMKQLHIVLQPRKSSSSSTY